MWQQLPCCTACHCRRRRAVVLQVPLRLSGGSTSKRQLSINQRAVTDKYSKIPTFFSSFKKLRERMVNKMANQYHHDRVLAMGPDFACLEWLMNAGATSVRLSDGTEIGTQREMREFLASKGFADLDRLEMEAPEAQIIRDFQVDKQFQPSLKSDADFERRWPHISPIHLKEVDATDAVISDPGFKYFLECRDLDTLVLNFNDYFGDEGLRELVQGRAANTLKDLEICFNGELTDRVAFILPKLRSLQRLHLYFLSRVAKRGAVLRQLKTNLPQCRVTFPEPYFISLGYETEKEKALFQKFKSSNPISKWLNDESGLFIPSQPKN